MKKLWDEVNKFIKKYHLDALHEVVIFCIITITIHFAYRYWANQLHYKPIFEIMDRAHESMVDIVFRQSSWFVDHVLNIPFTYEENKIMRFENGGFVGVNQGCSGLKPILQFVLLMLIYPGPWKRKLWFIPLGVIIVHLTNIFRICSLTVVTITIPQQWHLIHDYILRPFFYVVIFLLWVWWVERLTKSSRLGKSG